LLRDIIELDHASREWWNALAVKLPKQIARGVLRTTYERERKEALARMRDRGWEAHSYVFNREEANQR